MLASSLRVPAVEGEGGLTVGASPNRAPAQSPDIGQPASQILISSRGPNQVAAAASRRSRPRPAARPLCRCRFAPTHRRSGPRRRAARRHQRSHGGLLALLRQPVVDRRAGTLQGLLTEATVVSSDSATSLAEKRAPREGSARALVGRQMLSAADERQLDGLTLLVSGIGRGISVPSPSFSSGYGSTQIDSTIGSPGRRGDRRRPCSRRKHPLRPSRDSHPDRYCGDRVEPGAKRASALETCPSRARPQVAS